MHAEGRTILEALLDEASIALDKGEPVSRGWIDAVGDELVTALLTGEAGRQRALWEALAKLHARHQALSASGQIAEAWDAVLSTFGATADAAVRLDSPRQVALEPGKLPARLLQLVCEEEPLRNDEAIARLNLADDAHGQTKLSRAAGGLVERGLLIRRAMGRIALWEPTPRGRSVAALLSADAGNVHVPSQTVLEASMRRIAELESELVRVRAENDSLSAELHRLELVPVMDEPALGARFSTF